MHSHWELIITLFCLTSLSVIHPQKLPSVIRPLLSKNFYSQSCHLFTISVWTSCHPFLNHSIASSDVRNVFKWDRGHSFHQIFVLETSYQTANMNIYLPGESCLWLGHKLWFRLIPFPNGFGQYTVSLTHELIWHQAILLRQPTWTLHDPRFDRLPVVSLAQNMFVVHAQTIEVNEIFVHFHCLSWYRKDFVSKHPVSARSRQRGTDIQFHNNSYLRIICRTRYSSLWFSDRPPS